MIRGPQSRLITAMLALSLLPLTADRAVAQINDATEQVDTVTITQSWTVPDNLFLRARVTRIEPAEPFILSWRQGGEGTGGNVVRQDFVPQGYVAPAAASTSNARAPRDSDRPRHTLNQWSEPVSLKTLTAGRAPAYFFLNVMAGNSGRRHPDNPERRLDYSTNVHFEFELIQDGKVVKQLTAEGPLGGTVGLVFPLEKISPKEKAVPQAFIDGVCDLLTYAKQRNEALRALPWSSRPLPTKLGILTDVNGHGEGIGYGVRYTDPAIAEAELSNVREFGVNGIRGASWKIQDIIEQPDGPFPQMRRIAGIHNLGFPSPAHRKDRSDNDPEAGCPYAPGVAQRQQQNIALIQSMLNRPYEEIWSLTVDEIGAVVDRSAEGKAHLSTCPRCIEAYRRYVREQGRSPQEFGVASWEQLNPINVWDRSPEKPWLKDAKQSLNAYYSRLFINYSTAQLFTPLRDAAARANAARQAALDSGDTSSAAAKQPWLYTFALRGNTFLMRGHSLDFFDFYRLADNGFCHETSNRDPRVWNWDSYLLDVGRVIGQEQNLALALYIKPHRGAPIQRSLSAASRGARMLFWYTYGPDYAKGDSFSEKFPHMELTSKAARLLASAEDELWLSRDQFPAQAAIIKPRATEVWMQFTSDNATTASWEDAKFTYTALTDSFVPVDPLDPVMIERNDLSRYRTIHLLGMQHPRSASEKLLAWVEAGGTLVLHAGAMSRDEANQPASYLNAKLGVRSRQPVEMWKNIQGYSGGMLHPLNNNHAIAKPVPDSAKVTFIAGPLKGQQAQPTIGREVLDPLPGATVLARYADGGAAAIEHRLGKGRVVLIGLFAGLEYTAPQRDGAFSMRRDLAPLWRDASAGIARDLTKRPAWTDHTGVELRRIVNPQGQRSVAVMNWAYEVSGTLVRQAEGRARSGNIYRHSALKDVKITLPNAGDIKQVRSAWLQQPLSIDRQGDGSIVVTLPVLEEADVLVLE